MSHITNIAMLLATAAVVVSSACDADAKKREAERASKQDRMSREYETCSSSFDCRDGLRCVSATCRRRAQLPVADFHAAHGRSLSPKQAQVAVQAYRRALKQYKLKEQVPPPHLYCDAGHAMVRLRKDLTVAEEAAKTLHRCLVGVPVGSRHRQMALTDLVKLSTVGLDPDLLASTRLADRYLTKAPQKPAKLDVAVQVTGQVKTRASNYQGILSALQKETVSAALVACWHAQHKTTQAKRFVVTATLKSRFRQTDFEETDGYYVRLSRLQVDVDQAKKCAETAVQAAIKGFSKRSVSRRGGVWSGDIIITVGADNA